MHILRGSKAAALTELVDPFVDTRLIARRCADFLKTLLNFSERLEELNIDLVCEVESAVCFFQNLNFHF